jgi:hypothetical protein
MGFVALAGSEWAMGLPDRVVLGNFSVSRGDYKMRDGRYRPVAA